MSTNVCRICMVSKRANLSENKFKNIFTSIECFFNNKKLKLIDAIEECAPVHINENDNLPKIICLNCLKKLQTSYEFRSLCLQSDLKLNQQQNVNKIFVQDFIGDNDDQISIKSEPSIIAVDANKDDDEVKEEVDSDVVEEKEAETTSTDKISCDECGKKYANAKSFHRHLKQVHRKPKSEGIKCVHCSEKFTNDNDLYIHNEKLHTYRCEICAETFIWEKEIIKHCSEIHLTTYNSSSSCDLVKNEEEEEDSDNATTIVNQNTSINIKIKKSFKCSQCFKSFKTKDSLQIHLRIHTGERPYDCDVCGKCFKQKVHLSIHKRIHTGERNYICELCPKSFSTNSDLTKHKRVHLKSDERTKAGTEAASFACEMCDKVFIRNSNLRRHIEKMHKYHLELNKLDLLQNSITKCSMCEQTFNTSLDLKQHIKTIHKNGENRDPFTCNNCGKGFISKHELSEHLLLHAGQYSYMCDICGFVFEQSISLKSHMIRVHTNIKEFSCKICSKQFTNKSFLRLHAAVHNDDLPHKCKLCEKRFKWRVGLWRHEKEHSGSRPYKCTFCNRGFIEAEGLRRHVRVHTGERPYKCDICFKTFKQGLKHHIKMCHTKN